MSAQNYPFSFDSLSQSTSVREFQESSFVNSEGLQIHYYTLSPDQPIATLIFMHGGGACSDLGYFPLASELSTKYHIRTVLMDLGGHGKSAGRRGDCSSPDSVYTDIQTLAHMMDTSDVPLYLGGHSSGAGLILNYDTWTTDSIFDGYLFIAPEFGYRSQTARKDRIDFAKIRTHKFLLNAFSGGRLAAHSYAVSLLYPEHILALNPQIVTELTVNMAQALTPSRPQKQFAQITRPTAIFIGSDDELSDPHSVIAYHDLDSRNISTSVAQIMPGLTHLSILTDISQPIGETILSWISSEDSMPN